ncbi:MAG: 2-C-methyl-D-erythritol 2,4-cyclodiphosphate synthase [Proteobacteria bacterium]|nr:2-C-methyl-D-erythritol 2,4-cyclodiphosphate synthase [Pseudomonadota bacterium]MDA1300521.1 2-C-methyl-D-erythritol 2,4-cyclodiphosphate synthase [Pseudomonadota bacterium]
MRIGQGFDAHRFGPETGDFEVRLGGVSMPSERRILAHSDGDVLLHALMDAILGALALGDIGRHFPDSDERFRGINSLDLLRRVMALAAAEGWHLVNADLTLIAQAPRVAARAADMCAVIADACGTGKRAISVKATTTEKMGAIGQGEGIAGLAVVLMETT